MLSISSLSYSIIILLCTVLVSKAELSVLDGIDFSNEMVAVDLSDSIHPIEILEYSDGLSEWVPVSRNYGKGWESVFPFGYSVVLETLSMPQSNQGFFRKSYQASVASYENKELASRFLRQATFGPRIEDINNFPNVDGANFSDSEYSDFELWIDNQVAVAPFYHRAYWRQRSNPSFVDTSLSLQGNNILTLVNEVGHDPSLGHVLPFYLNNILYRCNWECRLEGHGGLNSDGTIITDFSDYTEDKNGNGVLDAGEDVGYLYGPNSAIGNGTLDAKVITYSNDGIPFIGSHIEDAEAQGMNKWDLNCAASDTKRIVWYEAAINGEDQLRQRLAWALSQYFVVGEAGSVQLGFPERFLNYYDIFVRHAFGNFRDILSEVTWSPIMGHYLSYIKNKKADESLGTFPDENYAREVMQLFTIGLWELNQDGTFETDSEGNLIPTYTNTDIEEFAKIFTGLIKQNKRTNIENSFSNDVDPLRVRNDWHDMSGKRLLDGSTLGPFVDYNNEYDNWESFTDANGNGLYDTGEAFIDTGYNDPELYLDSNGNGAYDEGEPFSDYNGNGAYDLEPFSEVPDSVTAVVLDIEGFLDHLFFHKNVPPFMARFLIQRFTVSNPSPNYIESVANAFRDGLYKGSGSGERGDMLATIKAVLLHPEAREPSLTSDSTYGKLREPIIRLMHLSRAFNLTSLRIYDWILFDKMEDLISQEPYMSPSVFNFYQPDFSPSGEFSNMGYYAPEFQITNDTTLIRLYNAYHTLIYHGINGNSNLYSGKGGQIGSKWYSEAVLGFSDEINLSNNLPELINYLDLVLTNGQLPETIRTIILNALNESQLSGEDLVKLAIYLFTVSNEFNIIH
ncbi:MAG: DUF1800 family protein [Coraliomargaritaceae bacterium]